MINNFTTGLMNVKSAKYNDAASQVQHGYCDGLFEFYVLSFRLPFCRVIIHKIKVRLSVVTRSEAEETGEQSRGFTRAIICQNSGYLHSRKA